MRRCAMATWWRRGCGGMPSGRRGETGASGHQSRTPHVPADDVAGAATVTETARGALARRLDWAADTMSSGDQSRRSIHHFACRGALRHVSGATSVSRAAATSSGGHPAIRIAAIAAERRLAAHATCRSVPCSAMRSPDSTARRSSRVVPSRQHVPHSRIHWADHQTKSRSRNCGMSIVSQCSQMR